MKFLTWIIQTLVAAVIAVALIGGWEQFHHSLTDETSLPHQDLPTRGDDAESTTTSDQGSDGLQMMQDFEASIVQMVQQASPSVVSVVANQDFQVRQGGLFGRGQPRVGTRELGGGSGFLVSRDGYIITNRHVVDDTRLRYTIVYEDGSRSDIQQIRLDPSLDIAVVRVDAADLPATIVPLTSVDLSSQTNIGQFAFAIGNSLAEFQNSVTFGVISGRNRSIDIGLRNRYAGLYQTDTAISQGNSGGPLFNTDGEVIGVNTAVSALGENIGFAIPITQQFVDATLQSIQQFDEIRRPFIGISYTDLDPVIAEQLGIVQTQGVYVQDVVAGSAASRAGLRVGDSIVSLDGVMIDDENPLQYLLFTKLPDDQLTVGVMRDGQELEVVLKLGEQ